VWLEDADPAGGFREVPDKNTDFVGLVDLNILEDDLGRQDFNGGAIRIRNVDKSLVVHSLGEGDTSLFVFGWRKLGL
jgi:hypothetical protein